MYIQYFRHFLVWSRGKSVSFSYQCLVCRSASNVKLYWYYTIQADLYTFGGLYKLWLKWMIISIAKCFISGYPDLGNSEQHLITNYQYIQFSCTFLGFISGKVWNNLWAFKPLIHAKCVGSPIYLFLCAVYQHDWETLFSFWSFQTLTVSINPLCTTLSNLLNCFKKVSYLMKWPVFTFICNLLPVFVLTLGGLGEAVAGALACQPGIVVRRLAVDRVPRSGPSKVLIEMFGISANCIVKAVKEMLA